MPSRMRNQSRRDRQGLASRPRVNSVERDHANVGLGGGPAPAMLDVRQVATLLACSSRQIYRLSGARRMPSPVRLGGLSRWSRAAVDRWIDQGCPDLGEHPVRA